MAFFIPSAPKGTRCALSKPHEKDAPADTTCIFEFSNNSPRYFCMAHAVLIIEKFPKSFGWRKGF